VLYEGGEKVDFHFFQVDELERMVNAQELPGSHLRGYRVVVVKDGLAKKLPPAGQTPPSIPKPQEDRFYFEIRAFWYGALFTAKLIRRRDLWTVKYSDWRIRGSLLKGLAWCAQSTNNWEIDTKKSINRWLRIC
jgi:hypothetical protein